MPELAWRSLLAGAMPRFLGGGRGWGLCWGGVPSFSVAFIVPSEFWCFLYSSCCGWLLCGWFCCSLSFCIPFFLLFPCIVVLFARLPVFFLCDFCFFIQTCRMLDRVYILYGIGMHDIQYYYLCATRSKMYNLLPSSTNQHTKIILL